jgi:uncharacterized protein
VTRQEEKPINIALAGSELVLDGIFVRGDGPEPGGALLAPAHPLFGGSMASPVLGELAYACKRAGYASVRFDWRGVGASAGQPSGEADQADADFGAALAYLEETVQGPLLVAGYSFGAAAALRAAGRQRRVRRLILVAPAPAEIDVAALRAFRGSALLIAGERDTLAPVSALEALVGEDPRCRVAPIPEADHFFARGLVELGHVVARWLGAD